MKVFDKVRYAMVPALLVATAGVQAASADFVAVGEGNAVTFTPSALITPLLTAAVAGVLGMLALWILWHGLGWIFKFIKRARS